MNAELEGIDPDKFYPAGWIAERLVSARRDGPVRTKTVVGYARPGARLPDGSRLKMVGHRRPNGWIFLGKHVLEFFAAYAEAWGSNAPDPSDSSGADSSSVTAAAPPTRARSRKPKAKVAAK
jgi:hypothetical protein